MSNVQSIFGNFNEIELTNDDHELVESCKDFIKESKEFTDYLIIEDDRNRNNVRWFSSKDLFVSGMTMLIIALKNGDPGIISTLSSTMPIMIIPILWIVTKNYVGHLAVICATLTCFGAGIIFLS